MEERLGIAGFCKARILASHMAANKHEGNHTFSNIYDELNNLINLSSAERKCIMDLEISIELENIIPVAENIKKLNIDTALITDMYLPDDAIRSLLAKAGVKNTHLIIKSSTGKLTGKLWKNLRENGFHFDHLGDNKYSDIKMAKNAGMNASLASSTEPTFFEKLLLASNLTNLAFSIREARLCSCKPFRDHSAINDIKYDIDLANFLSDLQSDINLPMLVKIAFFIFDLYSNSTQKHNLLFSSRGSYLLFRLCKLLSEEMGYENLECIYWLSSRDARIKGSKDYIDYCLSIAGEYTVFIDLTGSGVSFTKFKNCIERQANITNINFMVGIYNDPASLDHSKRIFERTGIDPTRSDIAPLYCFRLDELTHDIKLPEFLNYSPEKKVLDVVRLADSYLPIREPYEFDSIPKEMVDFSSSYCITLVETAANIIAQNYNKIRDELRSDSFNCLLKNSILRHFSPFGRVFNEFFYEGHLRSEILHVNRVYD